MIPNLQIPPLQIYGPIKIEPFGVMVGLALLLGYHLARKRAKALGLDEEMVARGIFWTAVGGFVGAHLVSAIFYFPEKILENPLYLLMVWDGLSSFGGFIGGFVGALVYYKFVEKAPFAQVAEAILFGLVPGWILGRTGCTIVFDHPGTPTDFFLGMMDRFGVVRHNLGFYEMLYTIFITAVLYALRNKRPFTAFPFALVGLLYAPMRFGLDCLRIEDKLYAGLTPGQYLSIGLLLASIAAMVHGVLTKNKTTQATEPSA